MCIDVKRAHAVRSHLCILLLFVIGTAQLIFHSDFVNAQGNDIIVQNPSYVFNSTLTFSDNLTNAASAASPRIAVEYSEMLSQSGLQSSQNLSAIAAATTPRIVIEYADFVLTSQLLYPLQIGTPIQVPQDNVQPLQDVRVSVNVTGSESPVKNVTLSYNLNSGASWENLTMIYNVTSNLYQAVIPGQPSDVLVKYSISAYDNADNFAVSDKSGEYFIYTVIPEFPSSLILPLFMIVTLLAIVACRRKRFYPIGR